MRQRIRTILNESLAVKKELAKESIVAAIAKLVELAVACLKKEGKVILFGNGGSAADAQHLAAELVGRFRQERKALAGLALSGNSSNLTCIGNDYGFEEIFARQIEAIGKKDDLAIGISTSGNSPNVLKGIAKAKELKMNTACLAGEGPNKLARLVDAAVCVPSKNTARIQEAHITIGHIICELIEQALFKKTGK